MTRILGLTVFEDSTHLTGSVYNFCCEFLAFDLDDFAEGVFNRRIIALYEVTINKLYSQG
jgi:hypothetical protein